MKNKIFDLIKIFFFLLLAFTLSKVIVCLLPNSIISKNILNSTFIFDEEGMYNVPFSNISYKADNFTDALIMNISLNKGMHKDQGVISKAFEDSYFYQSENSMSKNLKLSAQEDILNNVEYSRYWHGIQIIVRPLLLLTDYSNIRTIFNVITIILLCLSFILVSKKLGYVYSIALAISFCFMHITLNPTSIQFSAMTILTLLMLILLLKKYSEMNFDNIKFFFIVGCLTSFFDLLTFPLISYGILAICVMTLKIKEENSTLFSNVKLIVQIGIAWIFGYCLTFLSKWVISSIILQKNVIYDAITQFMYRTDINKVQAISRMSTLKINFDLYFNDVAIIILIISFIVWLLLSKYRKNLFKSLPLLLLSVSPYIWYIVLTNHSYIHSFFTNKIQVITYFSILTFFIVTTDLNKFNKDNAKNHTFVILAYKESKYLEECIKSVLNQTVKTNVVIATSTDNKYIRNLAKKYNLDVIVNKKSKGIANDFTFAIKCVDTELVTTAHQDDIYEPTYVEKILKYYGKYKDSLILFTDYYEIRDKKRIYKNKNMSIKKFLLYPLKLKPISNLKFIKRCSIRLGNSICCPSITYCKNNLTTLNLFDDKFKSNMDWSAWEIVSKMKGRFIYINDSLVGHRVHEESTTTKIINDGSRTVEDMNMFIRFWPKSIAKIINKFYKSAEDSNNIK